MYLYMLSSKEEALESFKVFKVGVEKQCKKQIKIVRSDKGGEYCGRYTENVASLEPGWWIRTETPGTPGRSH